MSDQPVSYRSKKRDIWQAKVALEETVRELEQQRLILERSLAQRTRERDQLVRQLQFDRQHKEELARWNEKLELLTQLTDEVHALDRDRIFEVCVTKVPYLLRARLASVYLFDESNERLFLKKHNRTGSLEQVVDLKRNPGSLMGQVVQAGRGVMVFGDLDRPTPGGPVDPDRRFGANYRTSSCMIAPLRAGTTVYGVLNLADPVDGHPFQPGVELGLLEQVAGLVGLGLRNIELLAQTERQAKMDALTRLYNHPAFVELLQQEVERADRYDADLALLMVDLKGLRRINANHGPLAGDEVLRQAAAHLRKSLRRVDHACRYGGDEFAILLPEQDLHGALCVARRLAHSMSEQRYAVTGGEVEAPPAIGVAQHVPKAVFSELLRRAEEAMRAAHSAGETLRVAD